MFLDPSNPGKSVLVGIVSRGKGCGQTGQTGRFIHTVHCTLVNLYRVRILSRGKGCGQS